MQTISNSTPKKYTASRDRAWWQKAKPQFWLLLAFVAFILFASLYGVGKLIFGRGYAPLPSSPRSAAVRSQDDATETPTPAVPDGPTATPNGYAPWVTRMSFMDNSKTQMSAQDKATYKYALPDDIRAQLEADWKDIVDHYYTLPYWRFYDQTLVMKYTVAGKLKPTPTGAPTATPVPMGTTAAVSVPGKRVLTLYGCDVFGTTCEFVDVWSDIMAVTYAYNGATDKVVSAEAADGSLAIQAIVQWKDSKWKLVNAHAQVVQYVTATPAR